MTESHEPERADRPDGTAGGATPPEQTSAGWWAPPPAGSGSPEPGPAGPDRTAAGSGSPWAPGWAGAGSAGPDPSTPPPADPTPPPADPASTTAYPAAAVPAATTPAPVPAHGDAGGYGSGGYGGGAFGPPPAGSGDSSRPRRLSQRALLSAAIALTLVAGGIGGLVGAAVGGNDTKTVVSGSGLTTSSVSNPGTSPAASGTVAAAAAKIMPSTVKISVSSSQESDTGSGVIIRKDGYVLTNNHVVSAAASGGTIQVQLSDGTTKSASIVGRDPTSDLAVIKMSGVSDLTPATFASSDDLKVGELVVAVGSPLGLSGTVTSGIVSALHRPVRTGDSSVTDTNAVLDAVQTDAPINPGNSGGPLVNGSGELVGINSAIATVGGSSGGFGGQQTQSGNIGVGFAISSNDAFKVSQQLIDTGKATHPFLGVSGTSQDTSDDSANGAQVPQVVTNSPAAKAGLKAGDVITKVDDRVVDSFDGLVAAVRSHDIGDKVTITYKRAGQTRTAEVTLAATPTSN